MHSNNFVLKNSDIFISKLLVLFLWSYQLISPDHGILRVFFTRPICRYYPTCSDYAIQSLNLHGVRSLPKIVLRVISCNPFSRGGYAPVKK